MPIPERNEEEITIYVNMCAGLRKLCLSPTVRIFRRRSRRLHHQAKYIEYIVETGRGQKESSSRIFFSRRDEKKQKLFSRGTRPEIQAKNFRKLGGY